jgi:Ca2+-binding EF-hand superfamily protein
MMNTLLYRQRALIVALAATVPATAALAQTADSGRAARMQAELQKRFAAADANADGRLTRDEAKGKMPRVYEHFDEIDAAHNGFVTLADIQAYAISQRGARQGVK